VKKHRISDSGQDNSTALALARAIEDHFKIRATAHPLPECGTEWFFVSVFCREATLRRVQDFAADFNARQS
jgi:hypothetical protein